MSAVGNIGQFVIDNQYVIEIILLILLAIIVIGWLVGRVVMRPRRNAEIKDLHAKIDKIESDINGIKDMTIAEYVSGGKTLVDKIERAVEAVEEEIEGIADDIVKDDKHLSESAWKIDETAESEIGKAVEEIGEDIEEIADDIVKDDKHLSESAWKIDETAESEIGKAVEEIGEDIEAVADDIAKDDKHLSESAWKIDETAESEIGKAVEEIGEDIEAVADEVVDADRELAGVVRIEEDDEAARIMESVLMEEKKGSKYMSRDWNKDQHGNVYTEEMLKNLIG